MGSIKFFKHLIVTVVILVIAILIAIIISLAKENSDLKARIESNRPNLQNRNTSESKSPSGETTAPSVTDRTANTDTPNETANGTADNNPSPVPQAWPPVVDGDAFPQLYAVNDPASRSGEYTQDGAHIYLTFDDGPSDNTSIILTYLKNRGITCTFFVIPSERSGDLLNRINNEGHAIGVHTANHVYTALYESVDAYLSDFNTARSLIYEQTGILTDFFRFPGGSANDYNESTRDDIIAEMTRRGFVYYDWNVDSGDAAGASWDSMYKNVRAMVDANADNNERSIVLFHDSPNANRTTWVIDDLIKYFQDSERGYTFSKIDMNTKPLNWVAS